jgi:hypothetical protein
VIYVRDCHRADIQKPESVLLPPQDLHFATDADVSERVAVTEKEREIGKVMRWKQGRRTRARGHPTPWKGSSGTRRPARRGSRKRGRTTRLSAGGPYTPSRSFHGTAEDDVSQKRKEGPGTDHVDAADWERGRNQKDLLCLLVHEGRRCAVKRT